VPGQNAPFFAPAVAQFRPDGQLEWGSNPRRIFKLSEGGQALTGLNVNPNGSAAANINLTRCQI